MGCPVKNFPTPPMELTYHLNDIRSMVLEKIKKKYPLTHGRFATTQVYEATVSLTKIVLNRFLSFEICDKRSDKVLEGYLTRCYCILYNLSLSIL